MQTPPQPSETWYSHKQLCPSSSFPFFVFFPKISCYCHYRHIVGGRTGVNHRLGVWCGWSPPNGWRKQKAAPEVCFSQGRAVLFYRPPFLILFSFSGLPCLSLEDLWDDYCPLFPFNLLTPTPCMDWTVVRGRTNPTCFILLFFLLSFLHSLLRINARPCGGVHQPACVYISPRLAKEAFDITAAPGQLGRMEGSNGGGSTDVAATPRLADCRRISQLWVLE